MTWYRGRGADAVTEFARRRLREDLGLGEPRLFGLSALEALEATVQGDGVRLSGSGLTALRAALTGFLATGKTRLFLHNVAERGAALVAGQRRNLQLGRLALDGGPHPSQVLTAFGVRMAELDQERRSTADKITGRIASGLPDLLTARSPAWQASLKERLDPCIERAIPADAAASAQDRLKTAQRRLEEAGRGIARQLAGTANRRGARTAYRHRRRPDQRLARGSPLTRHSGSRDRRRGWRRWPPRAGGWTAYDVPAWRFGLPVDGPGAAAAAVRRKPDGGETELRHRLADALNTAISAFEACARARYEDAAQNWARRL